MKQVAPDPEVLTLLVDKLVYRPGWNPYLVTELATDLDRRTSFRGEVKI